MTYQQYISYHLRGDAGVEERMIASLCKHFRLGSFDAFRLIYYYAMTYSIPSALDMLSGVRDKKRLKFRTDRRWVRIGDRFDKMLNGITQDKMARLAKCQTTTEAYKEVSSWYFFGRYAAYLFLEVYIHVFAPSWKDDMYPDWEQDENYTKGAVLLAQSNLKSSLDKFLDRVRKDTRDNVFSIETSLCAVEKFRKGTRYDGFYTERMLEEAKGTEYETLIYNLV